MSAVNGSFALFDDVISSSLPDPGQSGADDFRVTYADRSVHTFGRDGLLHQIVDRDGNAVTVVWDYNSTVANSQANYTIDKIRADTDGDVSGTWTYQRQIDVSTGLGTGGSPSTVTFAELLGSTGTGGTTPTGRSTEFKVATAASTGVGIGDVISIQPARRPTTCASSGASGCSLFSYSDSTSHRLAFVADPRWDQLTSGSNGYRFGITADFGTDPTTINDQSRSGAPLLRVLSWDHGGSSTAVRALWQDAAGIAAGAATHVDLTSDGRTLTEYVPQACTAGNCVSNPPTNADATLAGLKRTANEFDGLSQVNRTTQYRNPGTDLVVSRQGSRAGAKVDNFVDPLLGGQVAWTQSSDQYYASLVEGGAPGDVFRTTYTYDAHGAVSHAVRPVANALAAAHFIPVDTETRYDREGHPTQVADTFATNPGFESGTTGWTTTGSVTAYVASTVPDGNVHTGIASVATGTSGSVGQEFKLVPGQTVQLQGWDRTVSGGRADYALEWYAAGWHAFGGSPFTYPSDSSMAGHAWDVHIPTDGDGRVRITISNGTAAGTVYLDDVTAITRWASTTYAASGLPVTQSTLAASGPVTTAFGYDPRSAHPAIYPTTTTANDVATVVDATSEDLTSSATYDPWGRTLVATDPDGVAATTHYLTGSGDGAGPTSIRSATGSVPPRPSPTTRSATSERRPPGALVGDDDGHVRPAEPPGHHDDARRDRDQDRVRRGRPAEPHDRELRRRNAVRRARRCRHEAQPGHVGAGHPDRRRRRPGRCRDRGDVRPGRQSDQHHRPCRQPDLERRLRSHDNRRRRTGRSTRLGPAHRCLTDLRPRGHERVARSGAQFTRRHPG